MNLPVVDVPALRKIFDWVKEQSLLPIEEREWNQSMYRSITSTGRHQRCVATYTVDILADKLEHSENIGTLESNISYTARRILGLTYNEGQELFAAGNQVEDIEAICQRIARREDEDF